MSVRLFVALDLPSEVRSALAVAGDPSVWRPVPAENLHVTLAFLGSRAESDVGVVAGALEGLPAVGEMVVDGVLLLPPRRPRVMAVRLSDPTGAAARVQALVSARLVSAGVYEPERREWLPHVTVARARGRGGVGREGGPLPSVAALRFVPAAVTLYRSRLARGGSVYEPLARVAI